MSVPGIRRSDIPIVDDVDGPLGRALTSIVEPDQGFIANIS